MIVEEKVRAMDIYTDAIVEKPRAVAITYPIPNVKII